MELSTMHCILHSWLSLKTWVKVWLFWLNIILLAAFFFLNDPLALYTLVSLPIAFVLLLGIALKNGGLARILGIGHIVPWLPVLAYAGLRLAGDWVGPQITIAEQLSLFIWAVILVLTLAICLIFDAYDVIRWYRGERFILGTEDAYQAQASKRSPALAGRVESDARLEA